MGQKYRVGDRIICIKDYGIGATRGDLGTVIKLFDNPKIAPTIRWDDYRPCRHSAGGLCENGHGWFIYHKNIELLEPHDLGDFSQSLAPDAIMELLGG